MVVAGLGAAVLLGWALDIPALKSILPNWVTMKANTAVGFLLSGIALVLLQEGSSSYGRPMFLARVCAACVMGIGLLTLAEYAGGLNLGIDQLLFEEPATAVGTSHPGRMAPTTALSFGLVGAALWGLGSPRGVPSAQGAALTVVLIGWLGVTGYAYGVQALYGISFYTQMAAHTAVAFVLLGGGILLARVDRGVMRITSADTFGGMVFRRLWPAILFVPLVLGWFRLEGERAGLYGTEFGAAIFAISSSVIFSLIVWLTASWLHRADLGRREAERQIQEKTRAIAEAEGEARRQASEARRAREAIEHMNRDLERRLQERLTDLRRAEEQLLHSQKLEALGRLAGGVAHDFNNLLTVIIGYGELILQKMPKEDPLRDRIEQIRAAGERAKTLTMQLLAFGRKQVLQPRVLDIHQVVRDAERILKRLIGEDIDLVTHLTSWEARVKVDPVQLEQVIINLVVNARDAMPRGGKVTIETACVHLNQEYTDRHPEVTPGSYVMLAVSDTGVGMSRETLSRVFEPFFTTKERGKGTGLGLAMAHGVVKQSGGHIWVYSELGQGTTFKIYFPRMEAEAPRKEATQPQGGELRGSETILLVEDEEMVRRMAKESLEEYGYRVLEAPGGDEALRICGSQGKIDLLLTDVVMPGWSGRDLAKRVSEEVAGVKVLYMSGYTEDAIVHHGVLEDGIHFLQKPLTPMAIVRKVRDLLGEEKVGYGR
jgi:signal transduction histidine kinase